VSKRRQTGGGDFRKRLNWVPASSSKRRESLRLQPKAKAKAKAKGGSRPRTVTRKIQLTNPVLPYHDIMNDGYYIKA
jgi:hypothetical protein